MTGNHASQNTTIAAILILLIDVLSAVAVRGVVSTADCIADLAIFRLADAIAVTVNKENFSFFAVIEAPSAVIVLRDMRPRVDHCSIHSCPQSSQRNAIALTPCGAQRRHSTLNEPQSQARVSDGRHSLMLRPVCRLHCLGWLWLLRLLKHLVIVKPDDARTVTAAASNKVIPSRAFWWRPSLAVAVVTSHSC